MTPTYYSLSATLTVQIEVPPLQEIKHPFSLYFLVLGEYTLIGAVYCSHK
ncbi:hypothetical protein QJS10_CPB13g01174 [Acorus calamus]|uniref:Uncharacterized protein n=1 Tax=Acorus calamus TaxID=4465 RepID=A0AAV9DJC3_ACOCL|nr:hypothetical protein QJS10_CPB13g01174 [Acorus calamus]